MSARYSNTSSRGLAIVVETVKASTALDSMAGRGGGADPTGGGAGGGGVPPPRWWGAGRSGAGLRRGALVGDAHRVAELRAVHGVRVGGLLPLELAAQL